MASFADLLFDVVVSDEEFRETQSVHSRARWSTNGNGKRELVTLPASTFVALAPPTGASCLVIAFDRPPNKGAVNLTIKGVTGDTGIKLNPPSNPKNIPLCLPLGPAPSIGIANDHSTAQTLELLWL